MPSLDTGWLFADCTNHSARLVDRLDGVQISGVGVSRVGGIDWGQYLVLMATRHRRTKFTAARMVLSQWEKDISTRSFRRSQMVRGRRSGVEHGMVPVLSVGSNLSKVFGC